MKKLLVFALAGASMLAACGGVDRDGTRDNLIKSVEAAGGKVDSDCVDGVFKNYTDDEIKAAYKDANANPTTAAAQTTEMFQALSGCITSSTGDAVTDTVSDTGS